MFYICHDSVNDNWIKEIFTKKGGKTIKSTFN